MFFYILIFRYFISLLLLVFSYIYVIGIADAYVFNLLSLTFLWLISNEITHRYYKNPLHGFLDFINPNIKAACILVSGLFITDLFVSPPLFRLDFIIFYLCIELSSILLIYPFLTFFSRKENNSENTKLGISFEELIPEVKINVSRKLRVEALIKLKKKEILSDPNLHLDSSLVISHLDRLKAKDSLQDILMMDALVNDTRNIDSVLIKMYKKIKAGGIIIIFYNKLEARYSGNINYLDYFFHGVFPTLPFLKNIYKLLSRCKNRILSTSEMWGRLHRTGFEVEKEIQLKDSYMIISKKLYKPMHNIRPSYSPFITLDRVSLGGNLIKIHKIRSMYPYSEFNQKKIFELNSLDSSGKFNDDFRITPFGNFIRKYWIDEIPQLIDWFRGDIKIVGIRAMSQQYFSLYPKKYKNKYFQVKPGFVSPIFDSSNNDFNNIVETEERYLDSYLKFPIYTDLRYFFTTLFAIFSGVRSG